MPVIYQTPDHTAPAKVLLYLVQAPEEGLSVEDAAYLGQIPVRTVVRVMREAVNQGALSLVWRGLERFYELPAGLQALHDKESHQVVAGYLLEEDVLEAEAAPFRHRWVNARDVPMPPILGPVSVFHLGAFV